MVVTSGGDTLSFPFHVAGFLLEDSALCVYHRRGLSPADPRQPSSDFTHLQFCRRPRRTTRTLNTHFLTLTWRAALQWIFFFASTDTKWMDDGIKWIDGLGGSEQRGVAAGVNSLELQAGRRIRGERVKEAAKVLGSRDLFV